MKTLTKAQFFDLIKSATITQCSEAAETVYHPDDDQPAMVWGWIWRELKADGISLIYQHPYSHPEHKSSEIKIFDNFRELWQIQAWNIQVVDDGDVIDRDDLIEMILQETTIDGFDLTEPKQ